MHAPYGFSSLRWRRALLATLLLFAMFVAPAHADTFMWKVEKDGKSLYVLGSIHLGEASMYPLDPAINRAFQEAEALAVEVDVSPEKALLAAPMVLQHSTLPNGQTLKDVLSPSGYSKVAAFLSRHGLPDSLLNKKPIGLMSAVVNQKLTGLGYSTQYGVDAHYMAKAKSSRKPIIELESLEFQLTMDDRIPMSVQEKVLLRSLDEINEVGKYTKDTLSAWKRGDVAWLDQLTFQDRRDNPDLEPFYKTFFDERNANMASKIEGFLDDGSRVFVVIGAGHLVGANSVLDYLEDRGVTSSRVTAMSPGNTSPAREAKAGAGSEKQPQAAQGAPPKEAPPKRAPSKQQNFIILHDKALAGAPLAPRFLKFPTP